jgi:hypothetical protein
MARWRSAYERLPSNDDDAGIPDVDVRLVVYDLIEVDITKHQFTIEFLLEVSWQVLLDAGDADECILGLAARSMQHAHSMLTCNPATRAACQDTTNRAVEGTHSEKKYEPMFPYVEPDAGTNLMTTPRLSFENVIGLRGEER